MNSNKKPPLPNNISLTVKRPSLFCLNHESTQKKCDEYNLKQEAKNKKAWHDFYTQLSKH